MPDPAIDAISQGLPYTEPTFNKSFFGRRKPTARFVYIPNPSDPSAPPRRVINVDGGKGGGWVHRMMGGKDIVTDEKPPPNKKRWWDPDPGTSPFDPRLMPDPSGMGTNPHSSAQMLGSGGMDGMGGMSAAVAGDHGHHPQLYAEPLPSDFWAMPWRERRHLEKMRADQKKMQRDWEKAQKEQTLARELETARKVKEELKLKQKQLKEQEKQLKWQRKHPNRSLPTPTPATISTAKLGPPAQPNVPTSTKWMMMPTMEEFGVRRPFDASGRFPQVGAGSQWPMMSRTMTHAIVDMSREERVHATQAGRVFGNGWGGGW